MNEQKTLSGKKQSMITGALISSAGIFIAKFIGLFYAVPFNTLLGNSANVAMYGVAYSLYSYLLNIFTAGFPFAVATLIARYTSRGDYKTSLLIKKISMLVMIGFGTIAMLFLVLFSSPIAKLVLPEEVQDVEAMRTVLILISFALFFVPVLSATRGFYQGLKEMEVYALSQVLEQIARVAFLLIMSAVAIYAFNYDHVWAVYYGVISTSVAAVLAFLHLKFYDRKLMPSIKAAAAAQQVSSVSDKKAIFMELVFIALPFLFNAMLGYSDSIINTIFLNKGLESFGNTSEEIILITGAINYGVIKLMAIPMILAPGFSSAIIPHITAALEKRDYKAIRKNIRDCIDIVLYISIPVSFCLFVYAKPIYAIMFPPANADDLAVCTQILQWFSIEAFLSTFCPVLSTTMMAVGMRRQCLRYQIIMVSIKFILVFPLLSWIGYSGTVIASIAAVGVFIVLAMLMLERKFKVNWKYTFHKLLIIILGCIGLFLVAWLCNLIGLKGYGSGRIMGVVQLGTSGLLAMGVYVAITGIFQLPQTLFHIDMSKLTRRFKRGA